MRLFVTFAAAMSLSSLWQQMTRPTNSDAAVARGVSAYNHQRYGDAAREFSEAARSATTPRSAFNLGTAEVAAGRREEGSASLTTAMADPKLRAAALFNRGNSALAAKAYEHALRDYTDALKMRPADAATKRNLEIALRQIDAMRQQQRGQNGQQQQPQGQSPKQQQPSQGQDPREQSRQEADAEALLRSVQQQEQEELARMKRARGDSRRVGW